MSISTVNNRIEYQASGSSATFNFPYQFNSQSYLGVFVYNSSVVVGGIITPQVLNVDYVISGTANSQGIYPNGANIVMNSSPNAQSVLIIFRSSVITNNFSIGQNGTIPSTALNNELDYLTQIAQRYQDQVTRAVRMKDGYFGPAFDPTLPENIAQSANKRLIVNSSATGWTFDETLGAYIPNTVVVAITNSSITSLGGATAGKVLTSSGSSLPTWQAVNIGSSAPTPIVGILQNANGGTGTGVPYNPLGVFYASSAVEFSNTVAGGGDVPLVGNAGAPPSFQPLNLSSGSSTINLLPTTAGGTGVPGPYLPFGLIYASSANQFSTIPSGAAGLLLQSNGSSPPAFVAFAASNINSGIFAVGVGGTGTGTSYIQFGVVFASSATQLANTQAGGGGIPFVGNPGAAPSFQALDLASGSSTVNLLPTTKGGTGSPGPYSQFGVVTASSATQMTSVATGGADVPFTGNAGSAASFKALNLVSGSSTTGILPSTKGGTGSNTTFNPFGVIVASSATEMTSVPHGTLGFVLTSNGSSAPSFQAVNSIANLTNIFADYVATTSDNVIICGSGTNKVTIYNPTGNSGRSLKILRANPTFSGPIVIVGTSAIPIGGTSVILATQYDSITADTDGVTWYITSRYFDATSNPYTPTLSSTTNTGSNAATYMRTSGGWLEVLGTLTFFSVGSSTTFTVAIPSGLTIDTARLPSNTQTFAGTGSPGGLGTFHWRDNSVGDKVGVVGFNTSTTMRFTEHGDANAQNLPGTAFDTSDVLGYRFKVPIVGWQ